METLLGTIILVIIVLFIGVQLLQESIEKDNKKKGISVSDPFAKYIGGFSDIEGGVDAHILIKKDAIGILFGGVIIKGEKVIPMDMVINAEIKTETQITKEVGLGKMIVFGALAFAMKDDKNTVNNYLVISCDENGNKRDLIFQSSISEKIVKEIRRIKGIESIF